MNSYGSLTGHISNNIFYAAGTIRLTIAGNPSLTFAGNDYFTGGSFSIFWNGTTYNSFAAWQTATGQEKIGSVNVGLTTDPKLNSPGGGTTCGGYSRSCPSAYQLQGGSPMLPTAGLNLPSQFGLSVGLQDYYGNVIPSSGGYSVGAHQ